MTKGRKGKGKQSKAVKSAPRPAPKPTPQLEAAGRPPVQRFYDLPYSAPAPRLINPDIVFGFPKEGFPVWMDNAAVLKDAKNVENAKLFQNFIMVPEHAAMLSNFARYGNGIIGSEAFYDADLKTAPEVNIPKETLDKGHFSLTCQPEVQELYSKIWTEIQK